MTDHLSGGNTGAASAAAGGDTDGQGQDTGALAQEQLSALQEQIASSKSESAQLKQQLERVRSAFLGDSPQQQQDTGPDMAWYDDVLRVALEAEKQGRGIPVTVDLATRVKSQIEENAELKKELKRLQGQVKHISNPEVLHNTRVYENIDNHIYNTIERLYGEVDPNFSQYVSAKIASQLKELQTAHPQHWDRIRGSDTMQQRLVAEAVRSAIPSTVREKLKNDYLQNSPMTLEELAEAYAQADKEIKDPEVRRQIKEKARQEYFAASINSRKGNSFAGRVNRIRGY